MCAFRFITRWNNLFYCRNLFSTNGYLTSKAFVIQGTRSVLAFAEAERVHLAEREGLEPSRQGLADLQV